MLNNQNFSMFAGDTKNINVTMTDGTPLSGSSIKWGLLKQGATVVSKTTSNGITVAGSVFTIKLNASDTVGFVGRYYHEAEVTDMFGNVSTVMTGFITIEKSNV